MHACMVTHISVVIFTVQSCCLLADGLRLTWLSDNNDVRSRGRAPTRSRIAFNLATERHARSSVTQ